MSDEIRDNGPFETSEQAVRQFNNWARGLPMDSIDAVGLLLAEVAMQVGVTPSEFEKQWLFNRLDPVTATILSSWIIAAKVPAARAPRS